MKTLLLLTGCFIILMAGCRRKSSDDYNYYKPYTKDSLATDTIKVVEQKTNIEETKSAAIVPTETNKVDLNDNYFIIVASYAVEEFAISQKNELIEQGHKPEIFMVDEDGWYKLAVESHKTLSEARLALEKSLEKEGIFSNSRIVFKKSK